MLGTIRNGKFLQAVAAAFDSGDNLRVDQLLYLLALGHIWQGFLTGGQFFKSCLLLQKKIIVIVNNFLTLLDVGGDIFVLQLIDGIEIVTIIFYIGYLPASVVIGFKLYF